MPDNSKNKQSLSKDTLALILGGIFVLALVFAAYNYFSNGNLLQNINNQNNIGGSGSSTNNQEQNQNNQGNTGNESQGTIGGSNTPTPSAVWVPNNYNFGDIKAGSYTVKSGDTLWEIAVAVYGNGSQWTKILAANSSNIGYLPNGEQALIFPGQVLTIPS